MIVKLQQNHFWTKPALWIPVTHIFSIPVTCLSWTYVWCSVKGEWLSGKADGERPCCSSLLSSTSVEFSFSTQFFCALKVRQTFLQAVPPFWLSLLCVKNCCWCAAQNSGGRLIKEFGLYPLSWSKYYDQQNTIHTSNKSSLILTSSVVLRRGGLFILKEEGIWWFCMISSS